MFTGLVDRLGTVLSNTGDSAQRRLVIQSAYNDLQAGESIAVNGVCLTLLPVAGNNMNFDLSSETCDVTTVNDLKAGDSVNLERAVKSSDRFGGHYVSGHVDTKATIINISHCEDCVEMTIGGFEPSHMKFLLVKGSITIDGVSLTINKIESGSIKVMLVPHTLKQTTFGLKNTGSSVNIEFDYMTRIIAHQLSIITQSQSDTALIEV